MPINLTSPAFEDGDELPIEYSSDGDNVNPRLDISGVPDDAVTLVVIVEKADEEAEHCVHWMVWNIDPSTHVIPEGETPEDSLEGYNDYGMLEYTGPSKSEGLQDINFKVYALDIELDVDEDVKRSKLEQLMAGHILDEAVLSCTYG